MATNTAVGKPSLLKLWPWVVIPIVAIILPHIFDSGHDINLMSHMSIAIIFALSYNMLLGNTGLLSFGHAVYFGLGAYVAMHVLRMVNEAGGEGLPLELIPLVGALAGMGFGIIFGAVSVRRAGVVFAMITLGVGALVHSSSLMFTDFFGGEAGLFGDRTYAPSMFGIDYGSSVSTYYLIVAWTLVAAILIYLLKKTPLGWMANAVRDNPERAQFVGYDPTFVRFFQFVLSALFAGLAGGLHVLSDEIVNDEVVGQIQSGAVLLGTYIGGIGYFVGPIVGASIVTILESSLSTYTDAWVLYFGLLFIGIVMFAPMGIVGVIHLQYLSWKAGGWKGNTGIRLYLLLAGLVGIFGLVCVIELSYHYFRSWDPSAPFGLMGFTVDATGAMPWLVSFAIAIAGFGAMLLHAKPMLARRTGAKTEGGKA
ncbi:amino acid/amide ABC transporter membrane protein 2, HAAT family [Marinobacter daqiaonensis]|uniref:Amino acid/amide ABC transporter membrane protein 2, HAAT family n=1 Tax=Marinobacter daqiaonensis TaxID=650891 RepID=A0A1I6I6M6_9GAMM|nr:branched-chain amino acid ABC transporter permease [Marinobacter daqiaonensis]SFR62397.1 amino acid/amide ABC transporter membrane protein 2, HAAT family [Marinobacter daqiaonensis]